MNRKAERNYTMFRNLKIRTKLIIIITLILLILTTVFFITSRFTMDRFQMGLENESNVIIKDVVIENAKNTGVRIADLSESIRTYVSKLWEHGIYDKNYLKNHPEQLLKAVPIINSIDIPRQKAEELNIDFNIIRKNPRNDKYKPNNEQEVEIFESFEKNPRKDELIIAEDTSTANYYRAINFTSDCMACHGTEKQISEYWNKHDGKDPMGYEPENRKPGEFYALYKIGIDLTQAKKASKELSGAFNQKAEEESLSSFLLKIFILVPILIISILAVFIVIYRNFKIINKLVGVSKDVSQGNLSGERVNVRSKNELGQLASSINSMTDSLKDKSRLIEKVADGELNINVILASDEDEVGHSLIRMIDSLKEKSDTIQEIANGNLNLNVRLASQRDEVGFSLIKMLASLNKIFKKINHTVQEISLSSDQLSDASNNLSEGASDQAASLEEVTASLVQISSQVQTNTENVVKSSELADSVKNSAGIGNEQMNKLVSAMNEINNSADEIKRIVKVIDDIAFQTNLLSLNANIEAARVGKYGKGFAVVAESVRNLAIESGASVKETTALVDNAIQNIETGTELLNKMAEQFDLIVEKIAEVNNLSIEVANASQEQTSGLEQISTALNQVEDVVQSNTANAEENAATSRELAIQASELKKMMAYFRVKDEDNALIPHYKENNQNGEE